ncbi:MAG: helix-turn-helix transcriptional regulator [Candidatus Dormibacteraeota bacterium]|nr:helix-turn-helix transcriptional regulator [Candidatus Dormibacteraeota bacterium]
MVAFDDNVVISQRVASLWLRAQAARESAVRIGGRSRALHARLTARDESLNSRLSPRENHVLRLLSSGITTKEIAARLGISPNTAKYHLANIYRKLGTNNRVTAALAFRKMIAGVSRPTTSSS